MDLSLKDRIRGCLLGGAIGDALGAPVEFLSLAEIRAAFGPEGVRGLAPAYGRLGAITDDTQMTLFTVEGLVRAHERGRERGICHYASMVHESYLRWLETQGETSAHPNFATLEPSRLSLSPALRHQRGPGGTCLSALAGARMGALEERLNNSKGCGGVMRVAPVGLTGLADPFTVGCEVAAVTHSHPSGYLAAGALALALGRVMDGASLREGLAAGAAELTRWDGHEECLRALERAIGDADDGPATPESVASLGAGWVAEEALAIAVRCALGAESFADGVLAAVNHGGDSDSTGSIAGSILGTALGVGAIPSGWIEAVEARAEIEWAAEALLTTFHGGVPTEPR